MARNQLFSNHISVEFDQILEVRPNFDDSIRYPLVFFN